MRATSHRAESCKPSKRLEAGLKMAVGAFLLAWLAGMGAPFLTFRPDTRHFVHASILGLGCLAALLELSRQVPRQNVIAAAALIAVVSISLLTVWDLAAWPIEKEFAKAGANQVGYQPPTWRSLYALPACLPLAYVASQSFLRPLRPGSYYGWWLLGTTGLLATNLAVGWNQLQGSGVAAHGTTRDQACWLAGLDGCVQLVISAASLLVATPWLIDKRGLEIPPARQGTVVYFLLSLWLAVEAAGHHRWGLTAWLGALNLALLAWISYGCKLVPMRR